MHVRRGCFLLISNIHIRQLLCKVHSCHTLSYKYVRGLYDLRSTWASAVAFRRHCDANELKGLLRTPPHAHCCPYHASFLRPTRATHSRDSRRVFSGYRRDFSMSYHVPLTSNLAPDGVLYQGYVHKRVIGQCSSALRILEDVHTSEFYYPPRDRAGQHSQGSGRRSCSTFNITANVSCRSARALQGRAPDGDIPSEFRGAVEDSFRVAAADAQCSTWSLYHDPAAHTASSTRPSHRLQRRARDVGLATSRLQGHSLTPMWASSEGALWAVGRWGVLGSRACRCGAGS